MQAVRFPVLLGVAFCCIAFASPASAQFSADSKWVPQGANCLVLIEGDRIFASGIAKKENWADAGKGAFEMGTSVVPPGVSRVLVATQLDLQYMQPIWTTTVLADSSGQFKLADIASSHHRTMDTVADRQAMVLPGDMFLIQLGPSTLGAMAPSNRQSLGRWIEDSEAGAARMSPYLAEAVSFADKNSDVIIAFDLQHAISRDEAVTRLKNFSALNAVDIDTLANAVSRIRGFTLGVTVRDQITAALKIDFTAGTTGLEKFSKKAIIEAIENNGVMIDDVRGWELQVQAPSVILRGSLSTAGLRQINALVSQPVQAQFRGIGSANPAAALDTTPAGCTKRYFDQLDVIFRETAEFTSKQDKNAVKPYTRWFDKYANTIDTLPSVGVDPDLLDFGARCSEAFRDISQGLLFAGANEASRNATDAVNRGAYAYYNGYGYGYRQSLSSVKKAVKAQEYGAVAVKAHETMEALRNDLGGMRRKLSGTYNINF